MIKNTFDNLLVRFKEMILYPKLTRKGQRRVI